jgi:hypothetical protein
MYEDSNFSDDSTAETQAETERGGAGQPPRRTAIGLQEPEPESKPVGWFRRFLNRLLFGLFLGAHPEMEDPND